MPNFSARMHQIQFRPQTPLGIEHITALPRPPSHGWEGLAAHSPRIATPLSAGPSSLDRCVVLKISLMSPVSVAVNVTPVCRSRCMGRLNFDVLVGGRAGTFDVFDTDRVRTSY